LPELVVDSCVALKWFLPEEDQDIAERLLAPENVLHAPEFILAEIANGAWKNARRGLITRDVAEKMAALAPSFFQAFYSAKSLISRATNLAIEIDHPAYDCFYLALSIDLDLPLITTDAKLVRKLEGTEHARRAVRLNDWT